MLVGYPGELLDQPLRYASRRSSAVTWNIDTASVMNDRAVNRDGDRESDLSQPDVHDGFRKDCVCTTFKYIVAGGKCQGWSCHTSTSSSRIVQPAHVTVSHETTSFLSTSLRR